MSEDLTLNRRLAELFPSDKQMLAADVERTLEDVVNLPNRRRTYTAAITATGSNPNMTYQVAQTDWRQDGAWCEGISMYVVNTVTGAGSGTYVFSLPRPVATPTGFDLPIGMLFIYDPGANFFWSGRLTAASGATTCSATLTNDASGAPITVNNTNPTPVTNTRYELRFSYPIAGYPIALP